MAVGGFSLHLLTEIEQIGGREHDALTISQSTRVENNATLRSTSMPNRANGALSCAALRSTCAIGGKPFLRARMTRFSVFKLKNVPKTAAYVTDS